MYEQEDIVFISDWGDEHDGTHVTFSDGDLYCSHIGDIAFPKPTTPLSTD